MFLLFINRISKFLIRGKPSLIKFQLPIQSCSLSWCSGIWFRPDLHRRFLRRYIGTTKLIWLVLFIKVLLGMTWRVALLWRLRFRSWSEVVSCHSRTLVLKFKSSMRRRVNTIDGDFDFWRMFSVIQVQMESLPRLLTHLCFLQFFLDVRLKRRVVFILGAQLLLPTSFNPS